MESTNLSYSSILAVLDRATRRWPYWGTNTGFLDTCRIDQRTGDYFANSALIFNSGRMTTYSSGLKSY